MFADYQIFPNEWPLLRIGDFADVKGGKRLPAGTSLVQYRTNHPYIRIVDFKDGRVDKSNLMYVPEDVFPKISRYTISSSDIYVSIVGTIGLVGTVDRELDGASLTENAAKICNIAPHVDRTYLTAFLRSKWGQHQIAAQTVGSTQPKLALFRIADIRVPVPPIEEQRTIAAVLGALDDKIEQNRHLARTLERLARAIFRGWFVDFEPIKAKIAGATSFPSMLQSVFEALPTCLIDSKIGPVPEGWGVKALTNLFEVNPPRSLRKGEPAPYLDMKNMPADGHAPDELNTRPFGSGAKFANGDTLVARITPCLENGKTAFVDFLNDGEIAWGSTEYIVLKPHPPIPPIFAYLLARTGEFRSFAIQSMTGTSGRQRVPFSALDHFSIAAPPKDMLVAFGELVEPLIARSSAATRESKSLAQLRDLLLPRLLSGSVWIEEGRREDN